LEVDLNMALQLPLLESCIAQIMEQLCQQLKHIAEFVGWAEKHRCEHSVCDPSACDPGRYDICHPYDLRAPETQAMWWQVQTSPGLLRCTLQALIITLSSSTEGMGQWLRPGVSLGYDVYELTLVRVLRCVQQCPAIARINYVVSGYGLAI
jgi:hypothetical protein